MASVIVPVVMAHQSRRAWAEALASELACEIVWDRIGTPWDTGKRAMQAGGGTHTMIIQDDTILSEGLLESAERAVQYSGLHPVSLFALANTSRTRASHRLGAKAWWEGTGPLWGPALIFPTEIVPDVIGWCDRLYGPSYDTRLSRYFQYRGITCLYTVPSLVDHRSGHGTIMSKRAKDRVACCFGSGLDVDWSVPPVIVDSAMAHPAVRMQKGRYEKTARRGSSAYRHLIRQGFTEKQ